MEDKPLELSNAYEKRKSSSSSSSPSPSSSSSSSSWNKYVFFLFFYSRFLSLSFIFLFVFALSLTRSQFLSFFFRFFCYVLFYCVMLYDWYCNCSWTVALFCLYMLFAARIACVEDVGIQRTRRRRWGGEHKNEEEKYKESIWCVRACKRRIKTRRIFATFGC